MAKILIINSAKKFERPLADLFNDSGKGNTFLAWVADREFCRRSGAESRTEKRFFGPETKDFFGVAGFLLLLPVLWLGYLFFLSALQRREKIDKILCVAEREKIIFTPLARILRIDVYWLELPERDRRRLKNARRLVARPAKLIAFTAQDAENLAQDGFAKEKIYNISLGVNLRSVERQDDLFSSLAKADKPYSFYKNFSVGVVAESGDRRRLEILLQAVKGCVNLIPNFRLVVIGQGPESGNLNWLIKKLGLERRVWLVGEQKNLIQWLDDLDLYVVLAEKPGLSDLEKALAAASRGVPLLGFRHKNLSDIIIEGQNGLLNSSGGAEELARQIIAIEADEPARKKMGANGRQLVYQNFDRQKQLQRLREIIG